LLCVTIIFQVSHCLYRLLCRYWSLSL
jgi:hypothetical protein